MINKNKFDEKIDKIADTVVIGKSMEEFYTTLHAGEQQVEEECWKESMRLLKITFVIGGIVGILTFVIGMYLKHGGFNGW